MFIWLYWRSQWQERFKNETTNNKDVTEFWNLYNIIQNPQNYGLCPFWGYYLRVLVYYRLRFKSWKTSGSCSYSGVHHLVLFVFWPSPLSYGHHMVHFFPTLCISQKVLIHFCLQLQHLCFYRISVLDASWPHQANLVLTWVFSFLVLLHLFENLTGTKNY